MNFLITGKPGVGKTTAIKKLLSFISNYRGFLTEEIRRKERREGFILKNFKGEEEVFAYLNFSSPWRVGRYGVNLEVLERLGVKEIEEGLKDRKVEWIVIDEVGKMEMFSSRFQEVLKEALNSDKKVLATIGEKYLSWVKEVIEDTSLSWLIVLTPQNRNSLNMVKGIPEIAGGKIWLGAKAK